MPFARDDAAFRFDLTEPRHAGQNDTKSIRWIEHLAIEDLPLTRLDHLSYSLQFDFRYNDCSGDITAEWSNYELSKR